MENQQSVSALDSDGLASHPGYKALIDAIQATCPTYDTEKEEKFLSTQETQENSQDVDGTTDTISPAPPLRGNTQKIPAEFLRICVDSLDKPLPPSSILFRFATPFESYVDVFFSTQKSGKRYPKRLAGRKADLIRGGFIRDDGKEIEVLKLPKAEIGAKLIVSVELLAEVESITLEVVGSPMGGRRPSAEMNDDVAATCGKKDVDTEEKVPTSAASGGRRPSAEMNDVAATCLNKDADTEEKVRTTEASGGRRPSAEMNDAVAATALNLKKEFVPELDSEGWSSTAGSAQTIPCSPEFPPVNTFVDAGQNLTRHDLSL